MASRGIVSHIDLNCSDPTRSIPFYAPLLEYLGYQRFWVAPTGGRDSLDAVMPTDRCAWSALYDNGTVLNIEVRPPAAG